LRAAYPRFDEEAELPGLLREARQSLARAAEERYELLLGPVREQVRATLNGTDTPTGWDQVAAWLQKGLKEGGALAAWNERAEARGRVKGDKAPEGPAEELRRSLKIDRLELEAPRLSVEVTKDLEARPAAGKGNELRVWIQKRPDEGPATWVFEWDGTEE